MFVRTKIDKVSRYLIGYILLLVITVVSTVAIEENFDLTTHQSLLIGFIIATITLIIYLRIRSSRLKKHEKKVAEEKEKTDAVKDEGVTFEDKEREGSES